MLTGRPSLRKSPGDTENRTWPLANWQQEEPVGEAKPFKRMAEHREPCDSRGSFTVLGAPGGEIPPGDSTTAAGPGLPEAADPLP